MSELVNEWTSEWQIKWEGGSKWWMSDWIDEALNACTRTIQWIYSITFVSSVLLTLDTNHLNILSYIALDKAPMEYTTCTQE